MLDRANSPHQGHAEEQENREDLSIHLGPLHTMESLAESSASLAWLAIRRNGEDQGNRFASTVDPMDGQTTLSLGSAHYMNFFGDAPWDHSHGVNVFASTPAEIHSHAFRRVA
ncbi:hypothetical protein AK812_SmicGene37392 [Symbiodinium microadriaticum]|uniref:Uncharacterized protein n=1 Tax=Symbiodinium microadriaticum TaxID=2951 RepID=A0A1Q9CGE9_SYMMI|nr:hypothetical protein AK812_SmicGene37392 [Symbiodinium microadriaticum]